MLKIVYDLKAGYNNVELTENGIAVELNITDINAVETSTDKTAEDIEIELFDFWYDNVEQFCEQINFNPAQDALDYAITNYFDKRVKETEEFPWVEISNLHLESDYATDYAYQTGRIIEA